jgi:hypothetical protein
MIDLLEAAERELPALIADASGWRSLHIDYHPPTVERLYRPWREGMRLNLHRIHPCEAHAPLFHPHPWPSAMRVVSGRYRMRIGYGTGTDQPPVAAELILTAGACYAMIHADAWHDVRPLDGPSLSIMITGRPWPRDTPLAPDRPLRPLSDDRARDLLDAFRTRYPQG